MMLGVRTLLPLLALGCSFACSSTPEPAAPESGPSDDAYGEPPADTEPEDAPPAATEDAANTESSAAEGSAAPESAPPASGSSDSRTPEMIAAFVKEHRGEVRPCVSKEQRKDPKLGGDVVLSFVLDPAGKVKNLTVNQEETTLASQEAVECVASTVKTWQFPASSNGMETKVNYPFTFNPKK